MSWRSLTLAALLFNSVLLAQNTDYKIRRELMATLADEAGATAPFFVRFDAKANTKGARGISNRLARVQYVAQALQATADRSQAGARVYLRGRRVDFTSFFTDNSIYVRKGTLALARALAARPEVLEIVPEEIFEIPKPQPAGDSGTTGIEWGVAKIRADQAWGTTTGNGIVVANIDTGVKFDHLALVNQYRGNNGGSFNHSTSWFDPSSVCPDPTVPCDNNNHGTHTMGTMVGDDGGTNQIGVAPGANWIACKGCESNFCSAFALNSCADWVLNPGAPHVVSNSWGGGGGSLWYDSKVQAWRNAGLFPAFSNGNSGPSCGTAGSPGDNPNAFGIGASDSSDNIASFSSRGPSGVDSSVIKPDVSAPGVSVRSSVKSGGYGTFSGTSMASPHVAGTVALMWAADPTLVGNIALTEQILQDTAVPLTSSESCGGVSGGAIPNNTYGWGRIDALAAVNWNGTPNTGPTVTITAPTTAGPFPCDSPVFFTATAIDPEDENIASSINWTEDGSPLGTGGSMLKTYNCPGEVGTHTVNADATDLGGLSDSDFVSIEVYDPNAINAPSNLQATANGEEVTCTWQDNSTNNTGFQLQFKKILKGKAKKNAPWENAVPTAGADDELQVSILTEGKYDLRLYAYSATNTSDYSNVVRVTTTSGGGVAAAPATVTVSASPARTATVAPATATARATASPRAGSAAMTAPPSLPKAVARSATATSSAHFSPQSHPVAAKGRPVAMAPGKPLVCIRPTHRMPIAPPQPRAKRAKG